jgi:acetolactate synthase-1/2/3 large subunit
MDSVPLVAITCNVAKAWLGKDTFQEIDITGVTSPITKHNYIVHDVSRLAGIIREAFVIAQTGRPGPVLIDIPKDVTAAITAFEPALQHLGAPAEEAALPGSAERIVRVTREPRPCDAEIAEAAALINGAKRPFLYVGGGIISSGSCGELMSLAEKAHIPVAVSLMGKTAFPSSHNLNCGLIGMHGTVAANKGASTADLIIAAGTRFSDRVISDPAKFARQAKILHIDIDAAEINKNIHADLSLNGNLKQTLARLLPLIDPKTHGDWNAEVARWQQQRPRSYTESGSRLYPRCIYEQVHAVLGEEAIVVTDVGQHQLWTAQFYPFSRPRTLLTSGGLGTMGYGLGAAIGAQMGNPDRPVVLFVGDGGFRMNCNELATVAHYNLPVIILVMNNGTLGMVRQWQRLFYEGRYSQTTLDFGPDFVELAGAYGVRGFRAATEAEFAAAFAEVAKTRKAAVVDCCLALDEVVLPMVPSGKPIDESLLEL